jgi:NADH-quinone oxidoreductase subunit M
VNILEFIVFFPLIAALAILLGSPARFTALAAMGLNALATVAVLAKFQTKFSGEQAFPFQLGRAEPPVVLEGGSGMPEIALSFGVDGISLILLILTAIVGLAAVWVSPSESAIRDQRDNSPKLFYASLLLIVAGALGAFLSTDLFFLFAFHELALIPTFLMIGIFGYGKTRVRSAWTITIYLGVGSLVLLAGLIALVVHLGGATTSLVDMQTFAGGAAALSESSQKWIFLLLLLGFGVLVSLFPLHTWAPSAYADAPTPVAMLHAGVLKKFGLYGLIRVALPMLPVGLADWQNLMLILLIGNIIIIGLVTIAQKRLDLMLGHSSVMHMGFAFLGIASANIIGVSGAVMLMFAHGCSIALQFALCGNMRDRDPALLNLDNNGGLAKKMPALGLLFGFAAFASIGLPGFANFVSEIMVFFGAFKRFFDKPQDGILFITIAGMIALWGVVISAVYMLRAYRKIFMGDAMKNSPTAKADPPFSDLSWGERLPLLLLLGALLIVGLRPGLLLDLLTPTIESMSRLSGQL